MKMTNKMHICMLTSEFPPNCAGIGNYVYNLSQKLVELGHNITVITRGAWVKAKIENVNGIKIYRVRFIPTYPVHVRLHGVFVNNLLKSIGNEFDVIHSHSPLVPVPRCNIPHVLTLHICTKQEAKNLTEIKDLYSLSRHMFYRITLQDEINSIKSACKVTTQGLGLVNDLLEYGINPNKITPIGIGVDPNILTPKYDRNELRILYTGRLVFVKGLITLIKSAQYICREYPNVLFTILGDGHLRPRLQKMVRQLNLENNFSFLGFIPRSQLIKHYQNDTIYTAPSYYDALPTAILEAMACGMPIVSTNIPAIREAVVDGESGFLVPPREPKLLADSILKLLADKDLRRKMGQAARERVERQFTWDIVAEKALAVYNEIL